MIHNQHIPSCTCTHECPEHSGHCEGCLPKPPDTGQFCRRCADKLRDALTELPDLAAAAAAMPGGRLAQPPTAGDPTRRATKVDQHSPSPAWDTADETHWWTHSWATMLADELHDDGPFRFRLNGVPYPSADLAVRYLKSRFTELCGTYFADDLYGEALTLRNQLVRVTASDGADQRIPTPCPRCNHRTLIRPNGQENVICRNQDCAAVWYSNELDHLAKVVTE
jgi:hypothetical protein